MDFEKLIKSVFPGAKPVYTFKHSWTPKIPPRPFIWLTKADAEELKRKTTGTLRAIEAEITGELVVPTEIHIVPFGIDFRPARWNW